VGRDASEGAREHAHPKKTSKKNLTMDSNVAKHTHHAEAAKNPKANTRNHLTKVDRLTNPKER
jgi:hypothetical protein